MNAVDIIAQAIDKALDGDCGYGVGEHVAPLATAALDRAGYVIRKKPAPRKATTPVEPFAPNTGDLALDEFMRTHHDPKYKPLPLPKVLGAKVPNGAFDVTYDPNGRNRLRGGDNRKLSLVLAEAEALAKKHGWPGRYDIIGTKITN